jgi:acetoin:2,6-dichlorophenolindophenol oxidoreductase subunit beta
MRELSYREAIIESLRQSLEKDDRIFLLGEDIGPQGGPFGIQTGLWKQFGDNRVIDMPISEVVMPGIGAGAAMLGMRPIVDLVNIDFAMLSVDGIVNTVAKARYMSGGNFSVPLVILVVSGAGRGAAAQHSQSLHAMFMHIPGLKIAVPSTAYDAKGLLNTAIRDDNPVLYIQHRMLYETKSEVPEDSYTIPFGKAEIRRKGDDITIVATQRMVDRSLSVAEEFAVEDVSIEVIDPRTLFPLDKLTIIDSVKKTGRLITVDEGCKTNNAGSEIAAIIAEEAIDYLEAPIIRVAAPMTPVPYGKLLEELYVPNEDRIRDAVVRVIQ